MKLWVFYATLFSVLVFLVCAPSAWADATATLTGRVVDPRGLVVPNARVEAVNVATGVHYPGQSNSEGYYNIVALPPGTYHVLVEKPGFKTIDKTDVILHVEDVVALNFNLEVGSVAETITVTGGAPLINTESPAVSTVVDRQFAENLPLNGRSFQTLIQLTPGVVLTASTNYDNGQFSVNGQRAASNYWMVDGVSANTGIGTSGDPPGNGLGGSNAAFSVLGGTNSLVSVDAMQEFRIQTSTYAPEFGRTPGGQISIVTRSGTNQFHGALFDYLRNDKFDANNWFANATNQPKPQERQNDFGGTFSGPIFKNRTFFFFSYEGLRLRLPQVAQSLVPDLQARKTAVPSMQPFLNAFPLPNGPGNVATGVAQFNASYSNSASLDAYSIRIDHRLNNKISLFGRYNYSPSKSIPRGSGSSLSTILPSQIGLHTATAGATWTVSSMTVNDLRFNYSRVNAESSFRLDNFGGAIPLASFPFPSAFNSTNGELALIWDSLGTHSSVVSGFNGHNLQRQINLIDNVSIQKSSHTLKLGIDYRRLSPERGNFSYFQEAVFNDVPSSTSGNVSFGVVSAGRGGTVLLRNLGVFGQDTWRATSVLTITYGLRWDADFSPSSNPPLLAVTGFALNNLSNLAPAAAGTQPFKTTYGNFAPRIGVAYQLAGDQNWKTVLRGGFGVFYDLATSEVGNSVSANFYPFGASKFLFSGTFPFDATTAVPPAITAATLPSSRGFSFDPNLKLPYTLEWNIGLEQALGPQQSFSASYIGSAGRRLLQTEYVIAPNANFRIVQVLTNAATSDYDALQLQFQRRLSRGLQALASYTWSHSTDTASAGSAFGNRANGLLPSLISLNRGPSDFDIRHAFSVGTTYQIPVPKLNAFSNAIVRGWSIVSVFQARSAPPVNVFTGGTFLLGQAIQVRPNVNPGVPFYLFGSQYPGGKALNKAAFVNPPAGQQGNLGRNALRAFGATQWDFAVHRDFPVRESLKLQFRAEMFNILNHPNFGPPINALNNTSQFDLSTQTLGQSLAGQNLGSGAFDPLYQIGGPRSVQFALKVLF